MGAFCILDDPLETPSPRPLFPPPSPGPGPEEPSPGLRLRHGHLPPPRLREPPVPVDPGLGLPGLWAQPGGLLPKFAHEGNLTPGVFTAGSPYPYLSWTFPRGWRATWTGGRSTIPTRTSFGRRRGCSHGHSPEKQPAASPLDACVWPSPEGPYPGWGFGLKLLARARQAGISSSLVH